ncbi:hypothetical protein K3495_g3181 [Podosphaera aphanis]|nr:hypothetical protein K3495_g3181 [Podosphaera aphanis]
MFRPALRASSPRIFPPPRLPRTASRRFLRPATHAKKSWKWKSTVLRWGLAIGAVYYYNTSAWFASELQATVPHGAESTSQIDASPQPTIDAIIEEKRKRKADDAPASQTRETSTEPPQEIPDDDGEAATDDEDRAAAFNPETGEINWDCPCLGGMAHGPCGEEFKAAFSCFVHSKEEPKGVECIDRFSTMQTCFRKHPDIYGAELEGEEDTAEAVENVELTPSSKDVNQGIENPEKISQPSDTTAQSRPSQTNSPINHEASNDDANSKL